MQLQYNIDVRNEVNSSNKKRKRNEVDTQLKMPCKYQLEGPVPLCFVISSSFRPKFYKNIYRILLSIEKKYRGFENNKTILFIFQKTQKVYMFFFFIKCFGLK